MTARKGLLKAVALAALLLPLTAVVLALPLHSPDALVPPGFGLVASRIAQAVALAPLAVFLLTVRRLGADSDPA